MGKIWLCIVSLALWVTCWAPALAVSTEETREQYEQARDVYTAAWVSLAAYDDRLSTVARKALSQRGWHVAAAVAASPEAKARYLSAKKEDTTILAIAGTATWGDVKADLNIHPVSFHRQTPADGMKTHSGFTQYSDALLQAPTVQGQTIGQSLLARETKEKLILTGHSLGGAVAVLTGARLVDAGANQVRVITFGAPAVGNRAFQAAYAETLRLTPVVMTGDPVPGVLPAISSTYVPLPELTVWQTPPESQRFQHDMAAYVDSGLRQYYDAKAAYEGASGQPVPLDTLPSRTAAVYVLPVTTTLDTALTADIPYIQAALDDTLRHDVTGLTWAPKAMSLTEACRLARAAGRSLVLVRTVRGERVKDAPYVFRMTLTQSLYDAADGSLVTSRQSVTNTEQLTPIEAVLYLAFVNPIFSK